MRLGGVNFALGTLAWAFFLALVPFSTDSIRNGESGWTIRAPTLDVPGLNWLNDLLVHKLEWTGEVAHLPKMDFTLLQEQILLFLVGVRAAHPGRPRGDALVVGPRHARGAQLGGRGRGIGHRGQPVEDHDLRPLRRDRRHRRRDARHVLVPVHQRQRARAARPHLARAGGDVRHPPPRRRAARRVRVRRRHRGVPLDLVLVVPERRRRAGAHHLHLLRADPLRPRRHPARAGARRHPLARRPAEAAQEA